MSGYQLIRTHGVFISFYVVACGLLMRGRGLRLPPQPPAVVAGAPPPRPFFPLNGGYAAPRPPPLRRQTTKCEYEGKQLVHWIAAVRRSLLALEMPSLPLRRVDAPPVRPRSLACNKSYYKL